MIVFLDKTLELGLGRGSAGRWWGCEVSVFGAERTSLYESAIHGCHSPKTETHPGQRYQCIRENILLRHVHPAVDMEGFTGIL